MKITTQSILIALTFLILGARVAAAPLPRVMVLVEEKNLGTYSVSEAERVITQALLDQGIEVVDADFVKSSVNRDKLLHAATGGPNAAAAMGLKFGAEIVIVGEALAKGSATKIRNSEMRSYSATISLKAIKTDTSQIITTISKSVARMHVDDITGGTNALRDVSQLAMDELYPKLMGRYGYSSSKGSAVRILVSNINQLWQLAAIKDLLKQNRGISDVVQRSYVTGVAEFDVFWRGSSDRLAEEITLANPGFFKLRVLGITQAKLDVQLVNVNQ